MNIYAPVCVVSAFAIILLCWKFVAQPSRTPLAVYIGSYVITTVIGATVLGIGGTDAVLAIFHFDLGLPFTGSTDTWKYWILLYAPVIAVPMAVLLLQRRDGRLSRISASLRYLNCDVDLIAYYFTLFCFSAYCLLYMYMSGFLGNLNFVATFAADYDMLMSQRAAMMGSLGTVFFGLIYTTLPTLVSVALYEVVRTRSLRWTIATAASVVATAFFSLSTIQKGPLMVFLMGCCLALYELGAVRKLLIGAFAVGLALLSTLQLLFQSSWTAMDSVNLVLFRMASSFPFYATLFPTVLPYQGFAYGVGPLGFGTAANDNLLVFNYMYPSVGWSQGAAAAPAHMRAFAAAGFWGFIPVLLLIAYIAVAVGRTREAVRGPLSFALYIQGLMLMYYLTQTSVRGVLVESYGVAFAIVGIVPLWVISKVMEVALSKQKYTVIGNTPRSPRERALVGSAVPH